MNDVLYIENDTIIFKPEFTTELGTYRIKFSVSYVEALGEDTEVMTLYEEDWSFTVKNSCKPTSLSTSVGYEHTCT